MDNLNEFKLEGDTIFCIPIEEKYLDEYYQKLSNASYESIRNTGSKIVVTKDGLRDFIRKIRDDHFRADFFLVKKENNEIIGEVIVNEVDSSNRSANTRIIIYQEKDLNQKYGSQAMLLALKYAFEKFNLHRIELQVYSFNKRAIHVYEKLGFKQEGVLRDCLYYEGQFYDAVVMSILETEFNRNHG